MNLRALRLFTCGFVVCLAAVPAKAASNAGSISGVVMDGSGTPQMGATVMIAPEKILDSSPVKLLTNGKGGFASTTLPPGLYSVQVTLAGFLPTVEQHIEVSDSHATLLQIVMGSVFASLGQLRQEPQKQGAADDWVWVLRASPSARSVLRWDDSPDVALAAANAESQNRRDEGHGLVELSSGADRPASISNSPVQPGTAFAYDVAMGAEARLLMAGQFSSLGEASSSGLAAEWIPTGDARTGPATTLVVRQSRFGPGGPVFRGMRVSHDNEITVGDRIGIRYGGEFVFAGFGSGASALRPRAEVAFQMDPSWQMSVVMATHPWSDVRNDMPGQTADDLGTAVDSFDAFPTLMLRHGKPVFEDGLHEELAVKHSMGETAELSAAVFHDRSNHTAVLGIGTVSPAEYIQGFFGNAFAYDGGSTDSTGTRVVYEQRIAPGLTSTVIYDYSSALAVDKTSTNLHLRDNLDTRYRHSVASRVAATVPVTNTKLIAAYKWLNGPVVSQQDSYGEAAYGVAPYLSMGVRQPLPSVFPGHMVVQADMGNLLCQGTTMARASNRQVMLVPAYKYFRGGLSFQF